MPAIPLPAPAKVDQISAADGAPNSARSGAEYGRPVADAVIQAGGALGQVGASLTGLFAKNQAARDAESLANAQLNSSFQEQHNNITLNHPDPTGNGLVQSEHDQYMKFVEDKTKAYAATGASASAQRDYRIWLLQQGRPYLDSAAVNASKMAETNADTELDKGAATILNDIGTHGLMSKEDHALALVNYDNAVNAKVGLTKNQKDAKILAFRNKAAIEHFNAGKNAAKTPAEIQALITDLHTKYWQDQLDTPDYMRVDAALAQTAEAFGQISAKSASDPFINKTRLDPTGYDANMAAGEKAIRETPGIDPAEANKQVAEFRSDHTRMYFEGLAEAATTAGEEGLRSGKIKTTEEALKGIEEIKAELHKDPRWSAAMTTKQMDDLLGSLEIRTNNVRAVFNKVQSDLTEAHTKLVTEIKAEFTSSMASVNERLTANQAVPPSDLQHVIDLGGALQKIGGMTPDTTKQYLEIKNKALAKGMVDATDGSAAALDEVGRRIANEGHYEFKVTTDKDGTPIVVHTPTGKHSPGRTVSATGDTTSGYVNPAVGRHKPGGTSVIKGDSDHVPVTANIRDATSLRGLQSQAYTAMEVASASAHSHGVVRLEVVAGRGPGHKSHAGGYDVDYIGWQADGSPWTPTQRAQVARDMMQKGGVDRIGLYEGGTHRNVLHAGISHAGFGPAMWGAGNLTGGAASRNYVDPESRKLLAEFSGGHATGGRFVVGTRGGGSFYDALSGFEARGQNVSNTDKKTSSGWARGYFQITDGTWSDNAGKGILAKYPTASDAPYDVQKQVADSLLMKRWAPETLDKMRAAGWTIDPDKTLAENAAANGGGPGGPGRAANVDVPGSTWTQAQHDQMAVVAKAKADLAAGLASDPVSTTAALAHLEVPQLDSAAGFDAYKKLYDKLDAIHHFTPEQQRPLTQPAVTVLSNLLNSNDPNKMLQVWAGLARWSPQMQEAAYKQLHETAPFGATAGRFYASNKVGLANAMILGHNSLELNKGVKAAWQDGADTWFQDNMADITRLGFNQTSAAGLKEAVDALYAGRHGTGKPLNEAEYQRANEDVYGGKFDTVNGGNVIVPEGTTGPKMELAQQVWDWTAISVTHTPPMGEDPITHELQVIGPKGLALAVPTRVTEGVYAFMDPDGGLFHTMVEGPNGSKEGAVYKAYVTAQTVNAAAAQAQDVIANSPEGADVSPFPPAPAGGGPGGPPGQVFGYPADFYAKNPDVPNPKSTAASGFTSMDRSIEASGQGPAPLLTGSAAIGVGRNTAAESRGGVPPITPASDREMQDMADHYIETLKNSGSKISDESLKVFREEFLNHLRAQQMQ